MTDLCVAIFVEDAPQVKRDVARAAEAGADLVELRLDRVLDWGIAQASVEQSILPCIVTCRPRWEGGESKLPDSSRVDFLEYVAVANTRYVDLELETFKRFPKIYSWAFGTILSSHDFRGRPDRLYNIVKEMNENSAGTVNKIVWKARSIRDNLEAFELIKSRQKPTIAL